MKKTVIIRLIFWALLCCSLIWFSSQAEFRQFEQEPVPAIRTVTVPANVQRLERNVEFSLGPVDLARYQSLPEEETDVEKILKSVPLDGRIQRRLNRWYGEKMFCMLMAIAKVESEFDPEKTGDGGTSLGMFQINIRWQADRMKTLGITADELTDPEDCATVAADILNELRYKYNFESFSDAHAMAYNMGPTGARKALDSGQKSTKYSEAVMRQYQLYMEEMSAR